MFFRVLVHRSNPRFHEGLRHHPRLRQEHRRQRALRRPARRSRCEYTRELADADVILVNTCGFIDAAKKESIDALVEAGRLKDSGTCKAVVGVGCMVQRHKDELIDALPEVDLFLGAAEMDRLIPELEERGLLGADDVPVAPPGRSACSPAGCPMCDISRSAKGATTAARSARFR